MKRLNQHPSVSPLSSLTLTPPTPQDCSLCPDPSFTPDLVLPDSKASTDTTPLLISTEHLPGLVRDTSPLVGALVDQWPATSLTSHAFAKRAGHYLVTCRMLFIFLAILVFLSVFYTWVLPGVVLFATTGSFLLQPYDWYSPRAAARRLYPTYFTDDGNYTDLAKTELTMWPCPAPASNWSTLGMTAGTNVAHVETAEIHVMVADQWTLFPFLWDSILVNDTFLQPWLSPTPIRCTLTNKCHRCPDMLSINTSCQRWLPRDRIRVILVNYPIDRRLLPSIRTLLVVGEHMEPEMFAYLRRLDIAPFVRSDLRLAALMLTGEECNSFQHNYDSLRKTIDDRLVYLAHTYGNCRLNPRWSELEPRSLPSVDPIDLQQNIMYWPLGPSVERGFPSRLPELENVGDEEEERPVLLNLMVSINVEKPTRMQAWLEATRYCASLPAGTCYLHSNDFTSRVVRVFDSFTALSVHDFLAITNPTSTEYLPVLSSSTFTLCPAGKNPEQYRIWEAIMAGSIPIIEDPAITDSPEMHPAYGSTFRCTPVDVHRVLRKYRAPVMYVRDWRELEGVISRMGKGMILEKRRELKTWFREFKAELKRELIERLRWLNAAT